MLLSFLVLRELVVEDLVPGELVLRVRGSRDVALRLYMKLEAMLVEFWDTHESRAWARALVWLGMEWHGIGWAWYGLDWIGMGMGMGWSELNFVRMVCIDFFIAWDRTGQGIWRK